MNRLDLGLGTILVVLGFAVAAMAAGYTVGFMVDPLGPRALPFLVSGLFLISGSALILKGLRASRSPPGGPGQKESSSEEEGSSWSSQAAAAGILTLYAFSIPVLGFVLSTTLATGALARLFGARWIPGFAVGLAFGLALLALFSLGFGLALPPGLLFGGSL